MEQHYKILGVERNASIAEIKRAFRIKAKALHPDISQNRTSGQTEDINQKMVKLVEAYRTLLKAHTDMENFLAFTNFKKRKTEEFDYKRWLSERNDDESRTKLLLFNLFNNCESEAIEEYLKLKNRPTGYNLMNFLSRTDFMDCSFVLAEELYFRNKHYEAFELLQPLISMEQEQPYFKHFFPEVTKLLRKLLIEKIHRMYSNEEIIYCYSIAVNMNFRKNDKAYFAKHLADAYYNVGDIVMANKYMTEARRFMPKSKPLKTSVFRSLQLKSKF